MSSHPVRQTDSPEVLYCFVVHDAEQRGVSHGSSLYVAHSLPRCYQVLWSSVMQLVEQIISPARLSFIFQDFVVMKHFNGRKV